MKKFLAAICAVLALTTTAGAVEVAAPSALLMEKETGAILYAKDEHAKLEPASVTKVGSYAFSSSKIEEIYFEDSANGLTVGTFAFYNCPNLTSLRLPYGLTSIGANAISKTGLETIVIPDTVTEMGGSALAYNDNLKNVTLSKSMTAVPSRGFVGCESLTELTLPASIQDCGVTDTSVAFNDCTSLQNIYVADGSLYFKSVDGVLFDKNGANLRYYPEGRTAESYRIPEGTIRVGGNAFAGNLFLKSVSYPTTLERIGTKAFFGCENLKDYYFNGMTAPLLETTVSLTGAYANVALYANFVGLWGTTGTGGFVYNDWGLNLYYPQGAVGYTAYVWDKYFNTEKGSVNIMDESYFTPTDLTVTETGVRNALLTWTAAKQSNAEDIVYKVERSVAAHFQDDTQDTWTFEGFETLAEGLTACTYTDTTTLPFGRSYAYRVTAYSLTGETGPAAIGYLYIDADPNNADEMAVLELIKKIESGEEHFDFVEVMACPGGCVAGAGQPFARSTEKRLRAEGLYKNDKALQIKRSENNPIVKNLYDDLLKNREHELLHVHYPGHKADA